MSLSKLRAVAISCFVFALGTLIIGGFLARHEIPPYPGEVAGPDGQVLFTGEDIFAGQDVYQRYGLMDHGSVWGHGSQRGSEFSAVSLHMMGEVVADRIAHKKFGKSYESLDQERKDVVAVHVAHEIKENRYDAASDRLTLTAGQVEGLEAVYRHWDKTFDEGDEGYGFLPGTVRTAGEREQISRFFFWTAWAAGTNRPGKESTFTNNWPPDKLVGNVASGETYLWSLAGILSLFLVLGIFIWLVHHYGIWYGKSKGVSIANKLIEMPLTPSQYKATKFFLVVMLLFLLQTVCGGLLAHYTVNPGSFYFQIVSKVIPYSWAKSWHLQLAIFWIATTWVASAIYLAPILGGREPKHQGLLVQLLFGAILLVVVGSLTGEVLGIKGMLGDAWFWLGHQGWEYLELGRLWQILLFAGLLFWLVIVYRAVASNLRNAGKNEYNELVTFYVISAVLVVLFFGFGLLFGRGTHLTVADYWRWFVVHIWVESIFEFFGVAVIALLMVAMGLASARDALIVAYFTAAITFLGGILGTAHHFFWYGGPSFWLAIGSVFSSMEPIPLLGLIVRGWLEYRSVRKEGKEFPYRWPMFFLAASAFWNFLGAGVFGFLINLPIVNYFEHGTYLTMNHAHGALFGVYGMLSIGLVLFVWRGCVKDGHWDDKLLKISFFSMNIGLLLLTFGTLFPVGIAQVWTSFTEGLWAARDHAFFERGFVQLVGEWRMVPDLLIIVGGVLPLTWFLFKTYPHLKKAEIAEGESVWERMGINPTAAAESESK